MKWQETPGSLGPWVDCGWNRNCCRKTQRVGEDRGLPGPPNPHLSKHRAFVRTFRIHQQRRWPSLTRGFTVGFPFPLLHVCNRNLVVATGALLLRLHWFWPLTQHGTTRAGNYKPIKIAILDGPLDSAGCLSLVVLSLERSKKSKCRLAKRKVYCATGYQGIKR